MVLSLESLLTLYGLMLTRPRAVLARCPACRLCADTYYFADTFERLYYIIIRLIIMQIYTYYALILASTRSAFLCPFY